MTDPEEDTARQDVIEADPALTADTAVPLELVTPTEDTEDAPALVIDAAPADEEASTPVIAQTATRLARDTPLEETDRTDVLARLEPRTAATADPMEDAVTAPSAADTPERTAAADTPTD